MLVKRDPCSFGLANEFVNSFGGRLAFQGEMRAVFVVLGFPTFDLSTEIPFVLERPSSVEFL